MTFPPGMAVLITRGEVQPRSLSRSLTGELLPRPGVFASSVSWPAPQRGSAMCQPAPRGSCAVSQNHLLVPERVQGLEVSWDKTIGHMKRLAHRWSLGLIKASVKELDSGFLAVVRSGDRGCWHFTHLFYVFSVGLSKQREAQAEYQDYHVPFFTPTRT